MIEKIKLLTACGCSRMVEIKDNAREYIIPIKTGEHSLSVISDVQQTEPLADKKRLFRYSGKKTKDTHIRIFHEII